MSTITKKALFVFFCEIYWSVLTVISLCIRMERSHPLKTHLELGKLQQNKQHIRLIKTQRLFQKKKQSYQNGNDRWFTMASFKKL